MLRLGEDAPLRLRVLLRIAVLVQTDLLGLRLNRRPSPDHFLGWRIAARGDHLEVSVVKMLAENSDVRIVGLSATLPNVGTSWW